MLKTFLTVAAVAAVAGPCAVGEEVVLASQPAGALNSGVLGQVSTINSAYVFTEQRVGDDITVLMSGDITNVTWWGQTVDIDSGFGNPDPLANIVSFEIKIYADDGGVLGALIGGSTVLATEVVTSPDGTQGWDGSNFFRYEVELDTPIAVTAGPRIVSIAATVADDDNPEVFVWQYSAAGPQDGLYLEETPGPRTGSGLAFANLGAGANDFGVVLTSLTVEPPVTAEIIEQMLRDMADGVLALSLEKFDAPNANAAKGRRKAMSNMLTAAANLTAEGDYAGAIEQLLSLLQKLDGEASPPDWLYPSQCRDDLRDGIEEMIAALLLL